MLKRDEDEPPFHHGGLGIVLELIDRDIDRRKSGEHEPCDQEIVMRLSDYDNWLPCVGGGGRPKLPNRLLLNFRDRDDAVQPLRRNLEGTSPAGGGASASTTPSPCNGEDRSVRA